MDILDISRLCMTNVPQDDQQRHLKKGMEKMAKNKVTVFKPYPFEIGQKIHINGGRRSGDWEVTALTDTRVTLRCPVTGREFDWARFCYFAEECDDMECPSGGAGP